MLKNYVLYILNTLTKTETRIDTTTKYNAFPKGNHCKYTQTRDKDIQTHKAPKSQMNT